MTAPASYLNEPRLVGAGRIALVDGMVALFDEVAATERPHWVSLEAPSGWGKTRVAREFYARLAARQAAPAYWPETIAPASDADDVASRRKTVNPQVVHAAGSLPGFFWWGISCGQRNGVPSVALAHDIGVLDAHAPYLDDAWLRLPRTSRAGQDLRDLLRAVADEGAMEVAGGLVEAAAGTAIPGLGLVRWAGEWGWRKGKEVRDRRARLDAEARIDPSHQDIGDEVVTMLARLARPGLPVVVFVEDLHDADALLVDVLGRLMAADASILVVTTSWPGHMDTVEALGATMTLAGDRIIRFSSESMAPPPQPFEADAGLAPLGRDDLAAILHHYFPRVAPETEGLVLSRYTNPLALELFCRIDRVRRRFGGRELALTADDLDHLPSSIRGLYRRLWEELPDPVRHALAVATLGIPAVLEPEAGRVSSWHHELMAEAVLALGLPDGDEVRSALDGAATAYAWARTVSDTLRRFAEPDQLEIAIEDRRTYLFDDEAGVVKERMAARLAERLDAIDDADEREHAARLLLALHAEGFVADADTVGKAGLALVGLLRDDPRELVERIRIAERALLVVDPVSRDGIALRRELGSAQRNARLESEARATFDALMADLPAADIPIRQVLQTRFEAFAAVPDLPTVLEDLIELAERSAADLGEGDEVSLRAGNLVAIGLCEIGHYTEGLAMYARLVERSTAALGSDHRLTLMFRGNRVYDLGRSGRRLEALEDSVAVLRAQKAALGDADVDTIRSALNLADRLAENGNHEELLDEYRAWADQAEASLGRAHPETLRALGSIADTAAQLGDHEAAVGACREAVSRSMAATGPASTRTLRERIWLAAALNAAGDVGDAMAEAEAAAQDAAAAHGRGSEQAVECQLFLADTVARHGRDSSASRLAGIVDDLAARVGLDDPRTMRAAQTLVARLLDAGHTVAAVERLVGMVAVLESGTVPPRGTVAAITECLRESLPRLEPERALAIVGDIDPRRVDARYGEGSFGAVALRAAYADLLHRVGRDDEALVIYRDLVSAASPLRGDVDALVLGIRADLAELLGATGHGEEGVAAMESVVRDAIDAGGMNSSVTFVGGLVALLAGANRNDDALDWAIRAADAALVRGEMSDAYRTASGAVVQGAFGASESLALAVPHLERRIRVLRSAPEVAPDELGRALLARGYARGMRSEEGALDDLDAALDLFELAPDTPPVLPESARRLRRILSGDWEPDDPPVEAPDEG